MLASGSNCAVKPTRLRRAAYFRSLGITVLTERRFLQLSLVLPLAVPLAIGLMARLTSSEVVDVFAAIFLLSLAFGGLPYLLFVTAILFWSRNKSVRAIRRLSYFSPLLFVLATAALSLAAIPFGIALREIFLFIVIFSVYALLFGYLYVFVINYLYEIFFGKRSNT